MERRPRIALTDFSFSYPDSPGPVLSGLTLDIFPGEVVGIMGPGGAGKSTLAYGLCGFIPDFIPGTCTGSIRVGNADPLISSPRDMADTIGLVFQDFEAQLFSSTCELEVAFAMENRGIDRETMHTRVRQILLVTGLSGHAKQAPDTLSGGQKQRLVIGAVLALRPTVLLFDEPVTDLDPAGKEEVFALVNSIRRGDPVLDGEHRTDTAIIIEQETDEMAAVDRLILLENGRIVAEGPPRKVMSDVPLFRRLGLRPHPIREYFWELGIPDAGNPLTTQEAVDVFIKSQLALDPGQYAELVKRDQERALSYGPTIISIENLGFGYGKDRVLKGITLSIRQRECVAVIGPNGSGKSTLSRQLIGLIKPESGSVTIAGMDTRSHTIHDLSRVIGYVFQNPDHQIFSDTVFEEVAYGVQRFGLSPDEVRARAGEAIAAVGLSGLEESDPFSLPKGDRQRVAVASVLALQPGILVLDEPTTGLDYQDQIWMMELIRDLNRQGHTIMLITHAMWVVAEYAHRVIVLSDGKVRADDSPRNIFADRDLMAETAIRPPQITAFSTMLGLPMLSVEEMVACTKRGTGP